MQAMVLEKARAPLRESECPMPNPGEGEVLVRVSACAVCRTDLHVIDGDLPKPRLPLIPGHEIVGIVERAGPDAGHKEGERVGIPWLGRTCGTCAYCTGGRENLCEQAKFTGYDMDGGYAEFTVANGRYCFPVPDFYSDQEAAPLLCAGLIGFRSYRMTGEALRLGLYGFGAAAHIIAQVAVFEGRKVYAFTRPGDIEGQRFASELGAYWSGSSDEIPPEPLDAAIVFAPVGALIPKSLRDVRPGGKVICAGIHMTDVPSFPYSILWGERSVCSVANLTRDDGRRFLQLAPRVPVRTSTELFPLSRANEAVTRFRDGRIKGAAVLVPDAMWRGS